MKTEPQNCYIDVEKVGSLDNNVSPKDSNKTEAVSRSLVAISNGKRYIGTINKINLMLKDFLAEPATFCSSKKLACKKILQIISAETKEAITNPIEPQSFPSTLKSQLVLAAGTNF